MVFDVKCGTVYKWVNFLKVASLQAHKGQEDNELNPAFVEIPLLVSYFKSLGPNILKEQFFWWYYRLWPCVFHLKIW